ncbi:MAG: hypothetical protein HF314_09605 [Ignavibacteria bacterium]|jgi:hypothetical protein|nr:hypothetical protein [Ignavibacteria bacterium]MCU7503319.1 hypothetical protein [Ignavibacteria bacterium]MCU7515735.1 hypothetical protein [Ignavibacteria bacterium]
MAVKAVLKIDLLGDPSPNQCRSFYQELSTKNWQKMNGEEKLLVIYNNLVSYEEALETIKKELSDAAETSSITRYGALVHFVESNVVVFFCGKSEAAEKSNL